MLRLRGREAGGRDASRPCSRLPPRRGEAATSGATLLPVPVLVSIAAANLAANFAARVVRRVDVGVSSVVIEYGHQGVEIADRDVLPSRREHVRACDGAGDGSAPRGASLGSGGAAPVFRPKKPPYAPTPR